MKPILFKHFKEKDTKTSKIDKTSTLKELSLAGETDCKPPQYNV